MFNSLSWNSPWKSSVHSPVSFIILVKIVNIAWISKEKRYNIKYFYLIVKVLEENPKTFFLGGKRKRLSRPTKDVQGGAERLKLDGFG